MNDSSCMVDWLDEKCLCHCNLVDKLMTTRAYTHVADSLRALVDNCMDTLTIL